MSDLNPFDAAETPKKGRTLSPSQMTMYARCGEQYRRRYIEREIVPPAIAMVKGTSVHKGAEINHKQKVSSFVDLPAKEIEEIAVGTLETVIKNEGLTLDEDERSKGKAVIVDEAKQSVVRMTNLYTAGVAPRIQPKHIEVKETIVLVEGVSLTGIIDVIDEDDVIRDLKTSKKAKNQSEADESLQFTSYALIHAARFNGAVPANMAMEVLIDKKVPEVQTLTTMRTTDDMDAMIITAKRVADGVEKGVFPFAFGQQGAWWCSPKFCGWWSTCEAIPKYKR